MCNNVLELASNPSTAFTETELHADPTYDYTDGLPDWLKRRIARQQKIAEIFKWYQDLHWGWKLGVGIGLLIGAITLTAFSGGGWLGALGVVAQVAIGVGVAVGLYSLGAAFGFYDFSLEGLGNVALDAFLASSAIVFVSSGVSFIKHLARKRNISSSTLKKCTNQCFIAGTLVHCEDGLKKIEDVQVGDKVLAYNEETGEQAYKTVLHLFRNESKDWVGVTVNDKEIVSTPGHKYYLPLTKQWVSAKDLKVGDTVLLSNGQLAKIQATRSIHYDTPQTTYNFEVEDFHTYYVETGVLVHNEKCWEWGKGTYSSPEASLKTHFDFHGKEVGARDIEEYFKMAVGYADDVLDYGRFIKNVPGITPKVQRFTLGDNLYIDIVKSKKIIISFGEIW